MLGSAGLGLVDLGLCPMVHLVESDLRLYICVHIIVYAKTSGDHSDLRVTGNDAETYTRDLCVEGDAGAVVAMTTP